LEPAKTLEAAKT